MVSIKGTNQQGAAGNSQIFKKLPKLANPIYPRLLHFRKSVQLFLIPQSRSCQFKAFAEGFREIKEAFQVCHLPDVAHINDICTTAAHTVNPVPRPRCNFDLIHGKASEALFSFCYVDKILE